MAKKTISSYCPFKGSLFFLCNLCSLGCKFHRYLEFSLSSLPKFLALPCLIHSRISVSFSSTISKHSFIVFANVFSSSCSSFSRRQFL